MEKGRSRIYSSGLETPSDTMLGGLGLRRF